MREWATYTRLRDRVPAATEMTNRVRENGTSARRCSVITCCISAVKASSASSAVAVAGQACSGAFTAKTDPFGGILKRQARALARP